jgi:hypothetical protein
MISIPRWTGWICRLSVALGIDSCVTLEVAPSIPASLEDQVSYRYSSLSLS